MKANSKKNVAKDKAAAASLGEDRDRYRSLVDIGIALSSEKEISRILDLILEKALENTGADAASISLTENIRIDSIGNGQKYIPVLRFHRNADRSTKQHLHDKVLRLDETSIAGFVALRGECVRVERG